MVKGGSPVASHGDQFLDCARLPIDSLPLVPGAHDVARQVGVVYAPGDLHAETP
jgi:hypothetical protein